MWLQLKPEATCGSGGTRVDHPMAVTAQWSVIVHHPTQAGDFWGVGRSTVTFAQFSEPEYETSLDHASPALFDLTFLQATHPVTNKWVNQSTGELKITAIVRIINKSSDIISEYY